MAKIKLNFTPRSKIKSITERAVNAASLVISKAMTDDILRGVSPVKGQRFQKYSDSYKKSIRKGYLKNKGIAPINLYLTGQMLKSLIVKSFGNFIRIQFDDPKAAYHNEGSPKMPRRAILPKEGERFNEGIVQKITKAVKAAFQ